ncbi:Nn.00g026590.m01.CDS01 [Neocucurbitaria sp. VM-36]
MDDATLKIALEAAFDLLPSLQSPGLALHITLARLGYRFESQAFYRVLNDLRRNLAGVFHTEHERQMHVPVPQMRENPYRTLPGGFTQNEPFTGYHNFAQGARGISLVSPMHPASRTSGQATSSLSSPFHVASEVVDYQPSSQQWPGPQARANTQLIYHSANPSTHRTGIHSFVTENRTSLQSVPSNAHGRDLTAVGHDPASVPHDLIDPALLVNSDYTMGLELGAEQDQHWWLESIHKKD